MRPFAASPSAAFALFIFFALKFIHPGPSEAADSVLNAGMAKANINPPIGVGMTGFGTRDMDPAGNRGVHDDIFSTALYLASDDDEVILVGMDICFLSREQTDRLKGAIGRKLNLRPDQILVNFSHNHTGPRCGSWIYLPMNETYLDFMLDATVKAAVDAKAAAQPVTLWAAEGKTKLPMNRRKPNPATGLADFAPNPEGYTYEHLPVLLVKDSEGQPLYLAFSVAAHLSSIKGNDRSYYISSDYAGEARRRLEKKLGLKGSLFLQGAGGCAKCSLSDKEEAFLDGSWEQVEQAGERVTEDVCAAIEESLTPIETDIRLCAREMKWPLEPVPERSYFAEVAANPQAHTESVPEIMKIWAEDMMAQLDAGYSLPTEVPITVHGIEIGKGLRLVGIEGELTAPLGKLIRDFYGEGITFPLGYSNGCQMYLPSSDMIPLKGYEVVSYWEYRKPAPLKPGMESILSDSLAQLMKESSRN